MSSTSNAMKFTLRIWRQKSPDQSGQLVDYKVDDIIPEMSFLEMLDVLNEKLAAEGKDPVAFDSDCREGICGTCGLVINGIAHGPLAGTTSNKWLATRSDITSSHTVDKLSDVGWVGFGWLVWVGWLR